MWKGKANMAMDNIAYTLTRNKPPPKSPPLSVGTITNVVVTAPFSDLPSFLLSTTAGTTDKSKDTTIITPLIGAKSAPSNSVDALDSVSGSKEPHNSTLQPPSAPLKRHQDPHFHSWHLLE